MKTFRHFLKPQNCVERNYIASIRVLLLFPYLISDLYELADAVRAAVGLDGEGEPQREVVILLVSVEAGQLGRQVAWGEQFGLELETILRED